MKLRVKQLLYCSLHCFVRQIVIVICITLLSCIYIQQNYFLPRQMYNSLGKNSKKLFIRQHNFSQKTNSRCQPQSKIVFLKAHKSASSTIQNIFMRYGFFNDALFVLPAKGNYLGHPQPFNRHFVPPAFNYSILTHHSRFQFEEMSGLIPGALFITIIRDPVSLFESMFHYYKLDKTWKVDFDNFNLGSFVVPEKVRRTRLEGRIGINQMMFDLGLEQEDFTNPTVVEKYISELDLIFSLVMVSERMEESLVLLKELLCWDYEDMVVFKLNARNFSFRSTVNEDGSRQIRSLNSADQALYDHFYRKFDDTVERYGRRRMTVEVGRLRAKTAFYYRYCVSETVTANDSQIVRFVNTQKDNVVCRFLTNSELSLTSFLRTEQLKRHPGSVFSSGWELCSYLPSYFSRSFFC